MESKTESKKIHQFKINDESIAENYIYVSNMDPVKHLTGEEFPPGDRKLSEQVIDFFNSIGNKVCNDLIGDVDLVKAGVKSDIAHGIGRNKAAAFMALPEVIREGRVVDLQIDWKGRGYDTIVIAAPITITRDDYYMAVVIHRDFDRSIQRHYVHEVLLHNKNAESPSGPGSLNNSVTPGDSSAIFNILRKLQNVNN